MGLISDDSGTYTIGPNGEKRYATATEFSINGEPVYRFDPATGVLELSMSEEDIPAFTEAVGGLPAKEIVLPSPPPLREECHFHDVKEIKSLPRKDGSFFIKITAATAAVEEAEEDYRSLAIYRGSKSRCDNCSREFASGEVISVDESQGLAFCYSDASGGCGPAYVFSSGKPIFGVPMRFGNENLPPKERTPNYPNSPIVARREGAKPKSWLRNLLGL